MAQIRTVLTRLALALAPLAFVAGCAGPAPLPPSGAAGLFDDARFAPASEPIDPADVFRLTPEMQAYVDNVILPKARTHGLREALTEALYTRSKLQLEYDASVTRTASEAFAARQGNCLSLVIMTGALADAMDLGVTFQQVATEEMWSRSGGMYFMSGHVDLMLEQRKDLAHMNRFSTYTIDFMPVEHGVMQARPLSRSTVLAMFMNNRAAEAMVRGQLDDAYWRARQAIALDPQFVSAYNTLGVIYLRHGDLERAAQVLRRALDAAPDNPRILANYAEALQGQGRAAEAQAVQKRLAVLEPTPPFHWFVQGQIALHGGDYAKARELFLEEIARAPDYHEFHYALAVADFGLGRFDEARAELALARDDAVRRTDHDLYAAKLDKLNAYRPPRSLVQ